MEIQEGGMMLCDKELQREFRKYNRLYFNGELPEDVDCFFSPVDACYGLVQQDDGGWILQINPKYAVDGRMWRMTLIHECAHLAVRPYMGHGRKFQDEMKRLAMAGAFSRLW